METLWYAYNYADDGIMNKRGLEGKESEGEEDIPGKIYLYKRVRISNPGVRR